MKSQSTTEVFGKNIDFKISDFKCIRIAYCICIDVNRAAALLINGLPFKHVLVDQSYGLLNTTDPVSIFKKYKGIKSKNINLAV